MIALAALAVAAAAVPSTPYLKPQAVDLPPREYRTGTGPVNVIYVDDPSKVCRTREGAYTIACTIGKKPNKVISVLPQPCIFNDEGFAGLMCFRQEQGEMPPNSAEVASVSCQMVFEVFARLFCHEVLGHQVHGLVHKPNGRGWIAQK